MSAKDIFHEAVKIAVEIKSFLNPSAITDFYAALGQHDSGALRLDIICSHAQILTQP